ncbi:MAG: 30S ribosome-binding factor RbfA [Candidatus Omnitrophica bacterium]|nr:30S ribosome-binding factor RbfA [Candidatus Omnitrophota bacterium]
MGIRSDRVQVQMKKEISRILQEDLKDPRVGFVTVTRIDLTGDLRHAKVYYSILGDEAGRKAGEEGIKSASGFIRKLVGDRLKLKYVPELSFRLDRSLDYSIGLEKTFERIHNEREDNKDSDKKIQ